MAIWKFDPDHASIHFVVRYMVITRVHGLFDRWSGSLDLDPNDLSRARARLSIEAASVNTGNPKRDGHLRSSDFFDVARFPALTFESTSVVQLGERRFRMLGNLTLHGITREVPVDVNFNGQATDPAGQECLGFTAKASLNRRDFGLTWNQLLGSVHAPAEARLQTVLVSETVELEADVQAIRRGA